MVVPFIFLLKEIYQFAPVKHDMRVCVCYTSRENVSASLSRQCGGSLWRKTFLMTHSSAYIFSLFVQAAAARIHVCIDADPGYNITQRLQTPAKMTISKLPASSYDILRVQSTGKKKPFFFCQQGKTRPQKIMFEHNIERDYIYHTIFFIGLYR